MNKILKRLLIALACLLILLMVVAAGGWLYLKSAFLDFDKPESSASLRQITVDGYTFTDRNGNGKLDIYEDERRSSDERADDLLKQLTVEEKIRLLKGSGMASAIGMVPEGEGIPGAAGTIVAIPRLGIPSVYLSDGPAGLRIEPTRKGSQSTYYCTAFPVGTLLACTWNEELVQQVGMAMGKEALEYGIDVILGPGVNLHRHPLCGRNFEYYSEDPLLTGYIGAAMVNGIEANGVGASVKHFAANNQETNRSFNDVLVSQRALREIYLKGFEIIVRKSQPWTIMSSYNKINGTYASQSRELLTDILRTEWGFQGLVMTDWFGGQDAVAQVKAGNDLLEPGTKKQWTALKQAHQQGVLTQTDIDTAVRRILKLILGSRKMQNDKPGQQPDLKAHAIVTRQSASEGMVLLKNEQQTLPLASGKNVALFGVTSYDFIAGGTGSGDVNEAYSVSLQEGLKNAGFVVNTRAADLFEKHKAAQPKAFVKPTGLKAMTNPYRPPQLTYTPAMIQETAATADYGIITIGRNSGEGADRVEAGDFLLTAQEKQMMEQVCRIYHEKGKKVVVVLNIGGVIETASWKAMPDAILLAWQGGQEGGNAAAAILSGKVNPSGRLSMTFPNLLSDHASNKHFPLSGKPINFLDQIFKKDEVKKNPVKDEDFTRYEEGIYVGYRHFDKAGLGVSYPFGYGLSYTGFEYQVMTAERRKDTISVAVTVKNTGTAAGKEVVQVYVAKSGSAVDRPVQELKAFGKTRLLAPGESVRLNLSIPVSELRYWDEAIRGWKLEPGSYTLKAGSSSRDIRLKQEVVVGE